MDKNTTDAIFKAAYHAALVAQLVSLRARQSACFGYVLNQGLQIEASVLGKQIDALEAEVRNFFGDQPNGS